MTTTNIYFTHTQTTGINLDYYNREMRDNKQARERERDREREREKRRRDTEKAGMKMHLSSMSSAFGHTIFVETLRSQRNCITVSGAIVSDPPSAAPIAIHVFWGKYIPLLTFLFERCTIELPSNVCQHNSCASFAQRTLKKIFRCRFQDISALKLIICRSFLPSYCIPVSIYIISLKNQTK